MVSRADPTPTATVTARVAAGANDQIQPLLVKTVSYRIAPVQPAPLAPMPALVFQIAGMPLNRAFVFWAERTSRMAALTSR